MWAIQGLLALLFIQGGKEEVTKTVFGGGVKGRVSGHEGENLLLLEQIISFKSWLRFGRALLYRKAKRKSQKL